MHDHINAADTWSGNARNMFEKHKIGKKNGCDGSSLLNMAPQKKENKQEACTFLKLLLFVISCFTCVIFFNQVV